MISRLFKHTTLYALGPQIPKIVGIFILPIITKDLTPIDYGIAGLISSYLGSIAALKLLGLEDIIVNYYYRKKKHYHLIWKHLFGFLSRYLILFTILAGFVLYLTLNDEVKEDILLLLFLLLTPMLFFDLTVMFGSRYYQLKQKPTPVMLISASSGLLAVILNLYTISYLKMGFMGWYVSMCIASFFTFLCYSKVVFKDLKLNPFLKPRIKYLRKYLKVSMPLVPNKYGHYLLNTSDRVVMDFLKVPTRSLGLYSIGYNLGAYSAVMTQAIGIAIGPMMLEQISKETDQSLKRVRALTKLIQFVFIIFTTTAAIWSRELFNLLISNQDLVMGYEVAIFVIMAQNYAPLRFYFTNKMIFHEKTSVLWRITFVSGTINVLLNVILVPIYGYVMAAITTLISMLFLTTYGFYFKQYKVLKNPQLSVLSWAFGVIFITLLVFVLRNETWWIKGCVQLMIFIIFLPLLIKTNLVLKKLDNS